MKPRLFLREVEEHPGEGTRGEHIRRMREAGAPVPQLWHLFAFKAKMTDHLARFTQEALRGPSPLPPGVRELIAAFTSGENQCPY